MLLLYNAFIAQYQNQSLHIPYYYWYVSIQTAYSYIVYHDEAMEQYLLVA